MQTLNYAQGSLEWLAHRRAHFNASDAPAMLGCSPYKSRSQLLHESHTGLSAEVDAATQRRFDDGHRFEALARSLAEEFIGQELYPVVGVDGRLSASFDGLTMMEDVAFEHKTLNDDLRGCMGSACTGADLPKHYRVQMEQQLLISGAEKVLFMASKWTPSGEVVEERHCWYTTDATLRGEIILGWEQFARDLAAYVAPAAAEPAPVGRAPETLPALRIEVTGMVTASNLDAFKIHALAVFGGIPTDLRTDNDFADAEKTVKWCGDVEDRLAAAKQHALSQTESIDALFRAIDEISAEARRVRLDLDKKVKAKKEQRRGEIVAAGMTALREHITALNGRLGRAYMPVVPADFGGAIKGKKSLSSMEDAVGTELANAKIAANAIADRIQVNLRTIEELAADFPLLIPDRDQLVLKAPDDCRAAITSRLAENQARIAAERDRIRAEEAARLQREQEAAARALAATPAPTAAPSPAPAAAAPVVVPMQRPTAAPAQPATLNLGTICARFGEGFTVSADFLKRLGIEPAAVEKSAKKFTEEQFQQFCHALVAHARTVAHQQEAA